MTLRAAFFDVGDTLVEGWSPDQSALVRAALLEAFGERDWFDALIAAELVPVDQPDPRRQETNRWYERWLLARGIECDIPIDELRSKFAIPIDLVSTPVPGAHDAVRWCKQQGLAVVLVTNTLSRGDAEVLRDWQRAGLADAIDGIVSSHDVGWQKPHAAMFERALALSGARADQAFMVGDNLEADIRGAQQAGLRAIWRRTPEAPAPGDLRPDAVIRDLRELPAAVRPWL